MASSLTRFPLTLGDTTFQLSPLDDNSHESLDEWVRERYVEQTTKFIKALTSKEDKELALNVAYSKASELTWLSSYGAKMIGTVDGMAQLLYELARKNHPEVTQKTMRELMLDPNNVAKVNAKFMHMHPLKKAPTKKKRPSRRKKST